MRRLWRPVGAAAAAVAACCAPEVLAHGHGFRHEACRSRFVPPAPGKKAVDLNGVRLPDVCINGTGPTGAYEVFVIGDWGGLQEGGHKAVRAADHRKDGVHKRDFVNGLDDVAQHKVAEVMEQRAVWVDPDYVINVGDNFYWAGVNQECGTSYEYSNFSSQWQDIFEAMYAGNGLNGKQWLGVLGNHDYGGFLFTNGWDQAIKYTWMESESGPGRWMTPALFWRGRVRYPDFSVDYFFMDSNIFDAIDPFRDVNHNICSIAHNKINATCALEGGPESTTDCPKWFRRLWDDQSEWLEWQLSASDADWQIVVTHFPPSFGTSFWKRMASNYGIDLIITGHLHRQEIHVGKEDNIVAPTGWIVSGGGGGVTSDWMPSHEGDDSYGFMHLTLSKETITIRNVDHRNQDTRVEVLTQRHCKGCFNATRAKNSRIGEPWHTLSFHNSTAEDALFSEDRHSSKKSISVPASNKPLVHHNSSNASRIPLVHHVPVGASQSCAYDGQGCCAGSRCFERACNLTCCGFKSKASCLAHEELVKRVADPIDFIFAAPRRGNSSKGVNTRAGNELRRALNWIGFAAFLVSVGLLVLWKSGNSCTSRARQACLGADNRQVRPDSRTSVQQSFDSLISAASRTPSLDSELRGDDREQDSRERVPPSLAMDNELPRQSGESFDEMIGSSGTRPARNSNKVWCSAARSRQASWTPSLDRAHLALRPATHVPDSPCLPCVQSSSAMWLGSLRSQQGASASGRLLALPRAGLTRPATGQLLALPDAPSAERSTGQLLAMPDAPAAEPAMGQLLALPDAPSAEPATGQLPALPDAPSAEPARG